MAIGEDIDGYTVTRKQPGHDFQDVAEKLSANMCGLEPDTTATFEVCAVYVSGEEEPVTGCSSADLSTTKADVGSMEPQGPLPIPRIVEPIQSGVTDFGVRWEAGYDYDFYFLSITPEGGKEWSMKHDDDGTWGWQAVTGLTQGTTYSVSVRGCVSGIFGDPCSGWSPAAKVTTALPYGPDTCKQGFVWRDGAPGDHICVTPERRQKVADDFHTARTRAQPRNPLGYLGDLEATDLEAMQTKCLDGFVPRDIPGENVIVCVYQKEADLLKQENANPTANRVQP